MGLRYLKVKACRKQVTHQQVSDQSSSRRSFLKIIGFGAIAWSPLIESAFALSRKPFVITKRKNKLSVVRNGKTVWEVSDKVFSDGYQLRLEKTKEQYLIHANNLKYHHTNIRFSLKARVFLLRGEWRCSIEIPDLNISQEVDFIAWLDGGVELKGRIQPLLIVNKQVANISIETSSSCTLNADWKMSIVSPQSIVFKNVSGRYLTGSMCISPAIEDDSFLKVRSLESTYIQFEEFDEWYRFVNIHLPSHHLAQAGSHLPDVNLQLSDELVMWTNDSEGRINHRIGKMDRAFAKAFLFTEYYLHQEPQVYLTASVVDCWLPSDLGSFRLNHASDLPDYEYYGSLQGIDSERFQPQLVDFQPLIGGATVLSANKETDLIDIQPQEPVKKKKTTTSQLVVAQDKVVFKPKKALRFRILRPEDMLILEFELHNFSMVRQGAISFAELTNSNKKGLVIISFTSQHTLEEAFFESNKIPGVSSSDSVTLPAKHLRARKSRLVYELPAKSKGIPLSIEHLLSWKNLKLRVNPRAWIKIPQKKQLGRTNYNTTKADVPTKKREYLDKESKDYAIKLYSHSRNKSVKPTLYDDGQLGRLLASDKVQTIKPGFNIHAVKKINLNVEPVPPTDTSIEAPTLMYISPNQVSDFIHKKVLQLREHQEVSKLIGKGPANFNLAADNLSTNKGEVAELWHTILGVKLKNGKTTRELSAFKTIRALWADEANADYKILPPLGKPFMASLDGNDRHVLVHTTSNYSIPQYYPKAVEVKNLMLTSLGAYLDWHSFFDVPLPADTELNIIEWEHLATLGRDHYVKVVREGYLFPFGHRAALVKVTERKFHKETKAAVNRQRMYIVVLEKEVVYARNNPNSQFIPFAFQAVQINTTQTPNIDNPLEEPIINVPSGGNEMKVMSLTGQTKKFGSGGNTSYNFYINVNKKGFPFDLVVTDKEGLEHALRMPLVFLENKVARKSNLVQQIIEKYNPNELYNNMNLNEQDIAYAESMLDGDTSFETKTIHFGAEVYPASGEADIKFHPIIQEAKVFIKQLNEMTGVRQAAAIQLEDDNNEGTVFASVKDAVVDFSNGSDKAGGFMSPNMGISALSKLQGPVGGELTDSKALAFNPDDFFKALEDFPVAKIFGVIKIFDLLLGDMNLADAFDGIKNATKQTKHEIEDIKTEILYLENQARELQEDLSEQINVLKQNIKDKTDELLDMLNGNIPKIPNFKTFVTAEAFYAEYKWQPEFKSNPIKVIDDILHVRVDDPTKALTITTSLEKPFDGSKEASFTGSARFEKFGIDLVPLLAVNFNFMEFKTGNAQKTNVKVDIDADNPIQFKGALSFVNNLQNIIPSTGFSDDGPYIKLQPTQVTAGFTIGIPNVEVGICMISNISLGAHVTLPFTGAPLEMGFNFCKRENPFMLTISCFGGGGYFMMITTLKGLKSIEAALEFGAAISLNVGVASGGVSVMGGIYYKFEIIEKVLPTPDGDVVEEIGSSTIIGYIRINGHLSILGIISISMEFYLAFIAVFSEGKVQKLEGVATIKVKVEVLFFSKTVSVTVRRELKGADADPKFIEMIDEDDWQEYCMAFAG
ncbi:hypothetical protein [Carboxylicivirga sp. M1479]|uniref:hypothetical protein n=1 Tax=Carboxylicivirga sp. M1479 TaxID=2594476 RepID=UPI00117858E4|nr:hypothetical protein [Carboxylicivirga sp. M1479]TRX71566.1 hypothetical protein FNN09_06225 [Carboxylicivirga sp. M1479]